MSTEVPRLGESHVMPSDKIRRLQEYGASITRLSVPAAYRDELGLTDGQLVSLRADCRETQPAVVIDPSPESPDADKSTVRPLSVDSNGQVTLNFPRTPAEMYGWLGAELTLSVEQGEIVVTERRGV